MMKVIRNDECERARGNYSKYKVATIQRGNPCKPRNGSYGSKILNDMICGKAVGTAPCIGDSGGPYTVKRNDRHILVGVVSWGYGCGEVK